MQTLRHYLLAVQYFTRLPVVGKLAAWVGWHPDMLHAALGHFPGVGCLIGLLAAGCYGALLWALGGTSTAAFVAAVFSTAFTVLFTGGLHEDGLADVADGLGGSLQRERVLDIMKDSRLGAFGAMALMLALLGKIALLTCLGEYGAMTAGVLLLAAHTLSRLCPLCLVHALPYVSDSTTSKSQSLLATLSASTWTVAVLWCIAPLVWMQQTIGLGILLAAIAGSALCTAWLHWRFARRLQGYTGDCLGAVQQVAEIGFYLGAALALAR